MSLFSVELQRIFVGAAFNKRIVRVFSNPHAPKLRQSFVSSSKRGRELVVIGEATFSVLNDIIARMNPPHLHLIDVNSPQSESSPAFDLQLLITLVPQRLRSGLPLYAAVAESITPLIEELGFFNNFGYSPFEIALRCASEVLASPQPPKNESSFRNRMLNRIGVTSKPFALFRCVANGSYPADRLETVLRLQRRFRKKAKDSRFQASLFVTEADEDVSGIPNVSIAEALHSVTRASSIRLISSPDTLSGALYECLAPPIYAWRPVFLWSASTMNSAGLFIKLVRPDTSVSLLVDSIMKLVPRGKSNFRSILPDALQKICKGISGRYQHQLINEFMLHELDLSDVSVFLEEIFDVEPKLAGFCYLLKCDAFRGSSSHAIGEVFKATLPLLTSADVKHRAVVTPNNMDFCGLLPLRFLIERTPIFHLPLDCSLVECVDRLDLLTSSIEFPVSQELQASVGPQLAQSLMVHWDCVPKGRNAPRALRNLSFAFAALVQTSRNPSLVLYSLLHRYRFDCTIFVPLIAVIFKDRKVELGLLAMILRLLNPSVFQELLNPTLKRYLLQIDHTLLFQSLVPLGVDHVVSLIFDNFSLFCSVARYVTSSTSLLGFDLRIENAASIFQFGFRSGVHGRAAFGRKLAMYALFGHCGVETYKCIGELSKVVQSHVCWIATIAAICGGDSSRLWLLLSQCRDLSHPLFEFGLLYAELMSHSVESLRESLTHYHINNARFRATLVECISRKLVELPDHLPSYDRLVREILSYTPQLQPAISERLEQFGCSDPFSKGQADPKSFTCDSSSPSTFPRSHLLTVDNHRFKLFVDMIESCELDPAFFSHPREAAAFFYALAFYAYRSSFLTISVELDALLVFADVYGIDGPRLRLLRLFAGDLFALQPFCIERIVTDGYMGTCDTVVSDRDTAHDFWAVRSVPSHEQCVFLAVMVSSELGHGMNELYHNFDSPLTVSGEANSICHSVNERQRHGLRVDCTIKNIINSDLHSNGRALLHVFYYIPLLLRCCVDEQLYHDIWIQEHAIFNDADSISPGEGTPMGPILHMLNFVYFVIGYYVSLPALLSHGIDLDFVPSVSQMFFSAPITGQAHENILNIVQSSSSSPQATWHLETEPPCCLRPEYSEIFETLSHIRDLPDVPPDDSDADSPFPGELSADIRAIRRQLAKANYLGDVVNCVQILLSLFGSKSHISPAGLNSSELTMLEQVHHRLLYIPSILASFRISDCHDQHHFTIPSAFSDMLAMDDVSFVAMIEQILFLYDDVYYSFCSDRFSIGVAGVCPHNITRSINIIGDVLFLLPREEVDAFVSALVGELPTPFSIRRALFSEQQIHASDSGPLDFSLEDSDFVDMNDNSPSPVVCAKLTPLFQRQPCFGGLPQQGLPPKTRVAIQDAASDCELDVIHGLCQFAAHYGQEEVPFHDKTFTMLREHLGIIPNHKIFDILGSECDDLSYVVDLIVALKTPVTTPIVEVEESMDDCSETYHLNVEKWEAELSLLIPETGESISLDER